MMRRRAFLAALGGVGAGVSSLALGAPAARAHPRGATPTPGDPSVGFDPLDALSVRGAKEAVVAGDALYVAVTDGFVAVDASDPESLAVLAERRNPLANRAGGPLAHIYDLAVDGDELLVVGPAHPADGLAGAARYDVSDPSDPALLDFHPTEYPIHNADIDDGMAYLTANDGGRAELEIVDLDAGTVAATWSAADADPAWGDLAAPVRAVHDVTVRDGRAYVAHWDAGTWVLDVSDPSDPTPLRSVAPRDPGATPRAPPVETVELPGNSHYAATNGELIAVGREAWNTPADEDSVGGPGHIDLYDTTLSQVGAIPAPPTTDASRGGTWTTAHNFDFDGDVLYSSWYQGGVRVHDVSDPEMPVEAAAWRDSGWAFWTAIRGPGCILASAFEPGNRLNGRVFSLPIPESAGGAEGATTDGAETPVTDSDGMDGFGPLAALAGVGTLAAALRRR